MSDALRKILEDEWQKHRPPIAMGERRLALCVAAMQRAVDQETEKLQARVKELEEALEIERKAHDDCIEGCSEAQMQSEAEQDDAETKRLSRRANWHIKRVNAITNVLKQARRAASALKGEG